MPENITFWHYKLASLNFALSVSENVTTNVTTNQLPFWTKRIMDVRSCFSTGVPRNLRVPRVAARGSAETDLICLGRNSQPQFYAVVAIPLFHSYIGFHDQRKHLRKVPLQQKGWKILMYAHMQLLIGVLTLATLTRRFGARLGKMFTIDSICIAENVSLFNINAKLSIVQVVISGKLFATNYCLMYETYLWTVYIPRCKIW